MPRVPTIDMERLAALKEKREALRAAAQKVHEEILELHRQRGHIEAEIGRVQRDSNQNLNGLDGREAAAAVARLEKKRDALVAGMSDLRIKQEPIAERSKAVGNLYRRCEEHMKGIANA